MYSTWRASPALTPQVNEVQKGSGRDSVSHLASCRVSHSVRFNTESMLTKGTELEVADCNEYDIRVELIYTTLNGVEVNWLFF